MGIVGVAFFDADCRREGYQYLSDVFCVRSVRGFDGSGNADPEPAVRWNVYKASGYQEKYWIITAVGTFISAIGFAIIGYTFDFTGCYNLSFAISTGTVVIFFFASFILTGLSAEARAGPPSPSFPHRQKPAGLIESVF